MDEWTNGLVKAFPNLDNEDLKIVEPATRRYNCIAYAAGDTTKWWWPDGINYWPPRATLDSKIESLEEAFAGLGFEPCGNAENEDGLQKVALYEVQGVMKHAAAQMPNGRWRSKMGQGPVIEHNSPESLANGIYGSPTVFMRRATDALERQAEKRDTEP